MNDKYAVVGRMAEQSNMAKYKFRRALEEIEKATGRGTELVTVYVPPTKQISDVTNYLRNEYSQSSNIKSASTRKHVQQAIESSLQRLKGYRQPPATGLVVFTGHKQIGADQTQMVAEVLNPRRPWPRSCTAATRNSTRSRSGTCSRRRTCTASS